MAKHRVLIVDDSLIVRRMIAKVLLPEPDIEVVGMAGDPYEARDLIAKLKPDILTLDIEMPRMDGLTFLKILMEKHPMPVIILSSLSQANSTYACAALEQGAADVLAKPGGSHSLGETGAQLANRIRSILLHAKRGKVIRPVPAKPLATPPRPVGPPGARQWDPSQIILIGASTGGPPALKRVLSALPADMPGICLVQHMPAFITQAFAQRMDADCALKVREAADGDWVAPGLVLLAPGDYHMKLDRQAGRYRVRLDQSPKVCYQRPAVDVLFKSAVPYAGRRMVAVVLTGMGSDGAAGMLELRGVGAHTIAQDEASSVVYGMPRAAAEYGAVREVVPLDQIAGAIVRSL
ncbi:MAG: chemotaxis response regulator protein-glutamate methylesterase [Opitutales bacterium]